jgi:hypothetical protein
MMNRVQRQVLSPKASLPLLPFTRSRLSSMMDRIDRQVLPQKGKSASE